MNVCRGGGRGGGHAQDGLQARWLATVVRPAARLVFHGLHDAPRENLHSLLELLEKRSVVIINLVTVKLKLVYSGDLAFPVFVLFCGERRVRHCL